MKRVGITLLALVVILLNVNVLLKSSRTGDYPEVNVDRLRGIITISAEETARFLGGKGQVLLLSADNAPRMYTDVVQVFQSVLEQQGIEVRSVEAWGDNPEAGTPRGFFPGQILFSMMQDHSNLDAVISLMGIPLFHEPPSEVKTPVVAAYGVTPDVDVKDLIQSGYLSMVIIPRSSPNTDHEEIPDSPASWFNQQYQVVTADNLEALAQ